MNEPRAQRGGKGGKKQKRSRGRKKKFIHAGRLLFVLVHLTLRLYHLDPIRQKRKVMWKAAKLAKRTENSKWRRRTTGWGKPWGVRALSKREGSTV